MSERIPEKDLSDKKEEPSKAVVMVFVDADGSVSYQTNADPWMTIELANIVVKTENEKIILANRQLLTAFMSEVKQ